MSFLSRLAAILTGSLIFAVGIDFFLMPFKVLDGGLIGIALILQYKWGFRAGLSLILISMPIYTLVWFKNRSFFYNSLLGLFISSFLIDFLYPYHFYFTYYVKLSPMVSSIIGGILVGTGIGIMLKFQTSTGGADLIALLLSNILKLNVGIIIFVIDSFIIALGGLLISLETFLLSILAVAAIGFTTTLITSEKSVNSIIISREDPHFHKW